MLVCSQFAGRSRRHVAAFASLAIFALLFAVPARSQSTTWTGAVSDSWFNVANWTAGVPTPLVDAHIPPTARGPSTGVTVSFCRKLTLEPNATLTTSAIAPLTIHGDADVFGTVTTNGLLVFAGAGTIRTGATSPLPDVAVVGTNYNFATTTVIRGGFLHAAGRIVVDATLRVLGPTTIRGSALTGNGTLDLDGDVTLNPTAAITSPPPVIRCAATWTSTAAFLPTSGTVVLDGVGAQSLVGNPAKFHGLTIAGGAVVSPTGVLDVGGSCLVEANATLDLAARAHTFRGDFRNDGRIRGVATIELRAGASSSVRVLNSGVFTDKATISFRGAGTNSVTFSSPVPAVIVNAGGEVKFSGSSSLSGPLTLLTGTLRVVSGGTLNVGGDGSFRGGKLVGGGADFMAGGELDIDGDAVFDGTAADTPPLIRVAGNWTSNASFAPRSGSVELDGTRDTLVRGMGPRFDLNFHLLVIRNGTRRPASDLEIAAKGATIESSGRFAIGARRVQVKCFGIQVDGILELGSGGRIEADRDSFVDILQGGTLRMLGRPGVPATIAGLGAGGYGVTIAGRVEAVNFRFEGMGPKGIQVLPSTRFAPSPLDFRGGTFAIGSSAAGAVLLDVGYDDTTKPLELPFLRFENLPPTATFNVRTRTAGDIVLVNASGDFAGENFDDDPANKISWTQRATADLESFAASGEVGGVRLTFRTRSESDVKSFRLLRSRQPSGPFIDVQGSPIAARGGTTPHDYALFDSGVQDSVRYYYRLREVLSHDVERLLRSTFASSWRPRIGSAVFVGARSPTKTINDALRIVPSGGTILVAEGTYAPFTVRNPVKILTYGPGNVRVDTTTAPVVVQDLQVSQGSVTLAGLEIGSGPGSFGLQVIRCQNVVVLDELDVHALRSPEAVLLEDSPRVAMQRCSVRGAPGLRVRTDSTLFASLGSLDSLHVETRSVATLASLTPGTTTVDATSRLRKLPSVMPTLSFTRAAGSGKPLRFTVAGLPGSPFVLWLGTRKAFVDHSATLPLDMVLLLDPGAVNLRVDLIPRDGLATFDFPMPDRSTYWGASVPFQGLVFDLPRLVGRWTNVRDLVVLP